MKRLSAPEINYILLKYLLSFCQPSDSLLAILSTGPGPPQWRGPPASSRVSPGDSLNVLSTATWAPVDSPEPAELMATVISEGRPGILDSWTSVVSRARLETTRRDPGPPQRSTARAPPRRLICSIYYLCEYFYNYAPAGQRPIWSLPVFFHDTKHVRWWSSCYRYSGISDREIKPFDLFYKTLQLFLVCLS